jgi:hypothetical protein
MSCHREVDSAKTTRPLSAELRLLPTKYSLTPPQQITKFYWFHRIKISSLRHAAASLFRCQYPLKSTDGLRFAAVTLLKAPAAINA